MASRELLLPVVDPNTFQHSDMHGHVRGIGAVRLHAYAALAPHKTVRRTSELLIRRCLSGRTQPHSYSTSSAPMSTT